MGDLLVSQHVCCMYVHWRRHPMFHCPLGRPVARPRPPRGLVHGSAHGRGGGAAVLSRRPAELGSGSVLETRD